MAFFFTHANFARIALGTGRAVKYLHTREPTIPHGDIHLGNILIDCDGTPLLCDFGISRIRHEVTRSRTLLSPAGFSRALAPELGQHLMPNAPASGVVFHTNEPSDIFSLGMAFWTLWNGRPAFSQFSSEGAIQEVCKGRRPERPDRNVGLPVDRMESFWKLIQWMWAQEANERPTATAVLDELEQIFGDLTVTLPQVSGP